MVLARDAVSSKTQGPLPGSQGTHFLVAVELMVVGFLCAGPAPNPGGSRGVLMLAWGPVSLSLYLRSEHRLSRFPQTRRGRRGPGWGHGADSAASRSVAGLPKLSALLGLGRSARSSEAAAAVGLRSVGAA